jgi:hypothetical protein
MIRFMLTILFGYGKCQIKQADEVVISPHWAGRASIELYEQAQLGYKGEEFKIVTDLSQ